MNVLAKIYKKITLLLVLRSKERELSKEEKKILNKAVKYCHKREITNEKV